MLFSHLSQLFGFYPLKFSYIQQLHMSTELPVSFFFLANMQSVLISQKRLSKVDSVQKSEAIIYISSILLFVDPYFLNNVKFNSQRSGLFLIFQMLKKSYFESANNYIYFHEYHRYNNDI